VRKRPAASKSWLTFGTATAAIRFGYGVAALLAPSRPVAGKVPLAPHTEHFPEARLFVRGFAAHQLAVGLVGLEGSGSPSLRRPAMLLAAATDLADIAAAVVEARSRGRLDRDLRDGLGFSGAGLVSALLALRAT
jgi:hypothetical protein